MVYIGVDACKKGWFAVTLIDNTSWKVNIFPNISSLWNQCKDSRLILIDIPIGLRDSGSNERSCDKPARRLLGRKRGSSVFPVPCRAGVYANVGEASDINKRLTGRKLSRQVLGIIPKIKQVDQLLTVDKNARSRIREIHPEVCFSALNGGEPMKYSKKKEEGYLERKEILRRVYLYTEDLVHHALRTYPPSKLARDDVLDALVAAVTASKETEGLSTIPEKPEVDSKGIPMEMVYYLICK